MAWSGAGDVFNKVARGLIDAGAGERILTQVCSDLAEALMGKDWDTEDESIEEFAGDPVVGHAIRMAQKELELYDDNDDPAGTLTFTLGKWFNEGPVDYQAARWTLQAGAGPADSVPGPSISGATWRGFNKLVEAWAALDPQNRSQARARYLLS